ncbi:MAG: phosphotransferase [Chloroflexota bacterium]|nr:phosphotransferase [Chloroflexota bacterium]
MLDIGAFARAERATGGSDTTVWRLQRRGRQYALRVFGADQSKTLRRELVALQAARRGQVPVPRVFAMGPYQDRPALLTEWCKGRPLMHLVHQRPEQVLVLGMQFGRWHSAIHRIAAPVSLRANWIDWAGSLEPGLAKHLERLSGARQPRLLHLDYHPLNVLMHNCQVSAVLDWTNAHAGDPRADFARTVSMLRLHPPLGGPRERAGRLLLEVGWRYGYGALGTDMAAFYVWAGTAMQHDLGKRFSTSDLEHVRRWTDGWMRRVSL